MQSITPAAVALVLTTACCSAQATPHSDRDRLIGAWRLTALEQPTADGALHRLDCSGLLVFTRDGHISIQVMDADPNAEGSAYSRSGYEATYGTYVLNEKSHTFTIHVTGALVRKLMGLDLPRAYELKGNQLIVTSVNPSEHWRVVWTHY